MMSVILSVTMMLVMMSVMMRLRSESVRILGMRINECFVVNVAVGDVSLPQTLSPDAHHGSPRGPLMVSRAACTSTAHPLVHTRTSTLTSVYTHTPTPIACNNTADGVCLQHSIAIGFTPLLTHLVHTHTVTHLLTHLVYTCLTSSHF